MNCPRCRGVAPAGAGFCPHCGNDLRVFQQSPAQKQQVPVREQMRKAAAVPAAGYFQPQASAIPIPGKKLKMGWIIGGGVALLLMILGFFAFRMLQKTGKDDPTKILAKEGKTAGPMLQKTGQEAPILALNAQKPMGMPDDILKWLQHLERIEKRRGQLARKGLANLMVLAQAGQFGMDMESLKGLATGDPDANEPTLATDKIKESNDVSKAEWNQLRTDFDSYPPPAECQTIADTYRHALDETAASLIDVNDAIAKAKDDPTGAVNDLYAMQNKSGNIDEFGKTTDGKVQSICEKYNTRKWFSISSDFGNSSIFQSLGGLH